MDLCSTVGMPGSIRYILSVQPLQLRDSLQLCSPKLGEAGRAVHGGAPLPQRIQREKGRSQWNTYENGKCCSTHRRVRDCSPWNSPAGRSVKGLFPMYRASSAPRFSNTSAGKVVRELSVKYLPSRATSDEREASVTTNKARKTTWDDA